MHRQQSGRLVRWEATIRTGLNVKKGDPGSPVTEKVAITKKTCGGMA